MSEKIVGYTKVNFESGFTLSAGERIVIQTMGQTGVTGDVLFDGYVPEYNILSGTVFIDAKMASESPVIESLTLSSDYALPSSAVSVYCVASDPNNQILTFSWQFTGGTGDTGNNSSLVWTAPGAIGMQDITCTVTNTSLMSVSQTIRIPVYGVPVVTEYSCTPSTVSAGATAALHCAVTDSYVPQNKLQFYWTMNGGNIFPCVYGDGVWNAPDTPGTYTITCNVSEAPGAPTGVTFTNVTVI